VLVFCDDAAIVKLKGVENTFDERCASGEVLVGVYMGCE
jgi:hypothetical protein